MNEADIVAAPLVLLRDAYRDAALAHGAATLSGRHRVANRNVDQLTWIARELRTRGEGGNQVLAELREHSEPNVRVWAATHSLGIAPTEAEKVLDSAAAGPPGPARLAAEMTLVEWKAGRLVTD
jgi:hypothetical protein